jgi:transcriptional regulator with XRE-family HTH domain
MTETDKRIRDAIRKRIDNEAELARQMGVTRSHINQLLNGSRGKIPQSLIDLLDAVGLRLEVVPK